MKISSLLRLCSKCGETHHKWDMLEINRVAVCPTCEVQGTLSAVRMPDGVLAVSTGWNISEVDWAFEMIENAGHVPDGSLHVSKGEIL